MTESSGSSWEAVRGEVVRLHGTGRFDDALEHLARYEGGLWDVRGLVAFWRLCLQAKLGDRDGTLRTFAGALDQGCWFPAAALDDEDLALFTGDPDFARLAAAHRERQDQALATTHPLLRVLEPVGATSSGSGWYPDANGSTGSTGTAASQGPSLVAIHAAGANAARAEAEWGLASAHGWRVALPQSSRPSGFVPGTYLWDDEDRALEEIAAHVDRLRGRAAHSRPRLGPARRRRLRDCGRCAFDRGPR